MSDEYKYGGWEEKMTNEEVLALGDLFDALYSEWRDTPPSGREAVERDMLDLQRWVELLPIVCPMDDEVGSELLGLILEMRAVI